jgi:glycosyltransferase involved in cell wall biosynthesis
MTDSPIISVVIPCLNRAHFLVPTIESILNQNYPNIECIVVDGGSTDETVGILSRYGTRIRWLSEPDQGHADAINKGWKMSKGQILAWLNADDIWEVPDAANQAVRYLQEHPEVDVVYGDCGEIDETGRHVGMSYLHEWDLYYAIEFSDHCIPQPAAFIRKRILEKTGFLDTRFIAMDRDLWYRIGLVGTIRHIPILLACARNNPSFWHSKSYIVAQNCVDIMKKFFRNPALPEGFAKIKKRAISNAYIKGIDYAWIGRHWFTIFCFTFKGIFADWSNRSKVVNQLEKFIKITAKDDMRFRFILKLLGLALAVWKRTRRYRRA